VALIKTKNMTKNIHKETDIHNYNALHALSREIQTLKGIGSILQWDQEINLPSNAIKIRAEQIALLNVMVHKKQTSKEYRNNLKKLIHLETGKILAKTLNNEKKAAIREWYRTYTKLTCLPSSLVEKYALLTSEAQHAWIKARRHNNFFEFAPYLERIVTMCREKAEIIKYKKHPYDVLLDEHEPDWTTQQVELLFSVMKPAMLNFLRRIIAKPKINNNYLYGSFSKNKQLDFSHLVLKKIGYDFESGRLDLSVHPFTTSFHPTDVRLTTAIHPKSLMSSISATIHEGGHGLYELGLQEKLFGSPLCEAVSSGIHESQSRLWETQLGQSVQFWQHFYPLLKKTFPRTLGKISLKQFYMAINRIEPGPIRIEADEITYNLHVILRFEIEKALIEGTLAVKDIPETWNNKMKQYLNVTVKSDTEGCLQDIHWAIGAFGYFPTYVLGNLYAAQLFAAIKKQYPNWEKDIVQGNFLFIKQWLYKNIYRYGKQYTSSMLIKKITGSRLEANYFIEYLNEKYQKIFNLDPYDKKK
jgi:carboxypeptidase Taq